MLSGEDGLFQNLEFTQTVLLVIGILWVAKSLWGFSAPESFQKVARWWTGISVRGGVVMGWFVIALSLTLGFIVVLDLTLAQKVLALIALVYAGSASLFFKPQSLVRLIDVLFVNRSPLMVRLTFLVNLLIGVLVVVVALSGR